MSPLDSAATMTHTAEASAAVTYTSTETAANTTTLATRFGTFEVDLDKSIHMPQGPIGFTDQQRFAILDLPEAENSPFKLYQSVEDPAVTFIVSLLPAEQELIDEKDLQAACSGYSIQRENAAFFLITKIAKDAQGNAVTTVNLRAPIVVDVTNLVARQAVFAGDRYPMQHPLQ